MRQAWREILEQVNDGTAVRGDQKDHSHIFVPVRLKTLASQVMLTSTRLLTIGFSGRLLIEQRGMFLVNTKLPRCIAG